MGFDLQQRICSAGDNTASKKLITLEKPRAKAVPNELIRNQREFLSSAEVHSKLTEREFI